MSDFDTLVAEMNKSVNNNLNKVIYSEKLNNILTERFKGWTETRFRDETGLSEGVLKKIRAGSQGEIPLRTMISICIGLNLSKVEAEELMQRAGHILTNRKEHIIYAELLYGKFVGFNDQFGKKTRIDYANEFLTLRESKNLNRRAKNN